MSEQVKETKTNDEKKGNLGFVGPSLGAVAGRLKHGGILLDVLNKSIS